MNEAIHLRGQAETLAGGMPALLADAEHLAATVLLGVHGRRRSGMGDEFWQHRPAAPGDSARMIDWRRSARSDAQFVQEKEWQAAQSVTIWPDNAKSMQFSSSPKLPEKLDRARLLAMAAAILLIRGGERVALAGSGERPRQGEAQLARFAIALAQEGAAQDYGVPEAAGLPMQSRALFISDFLGDMGATTAALSAAAERGVRGAIVQILDPQEEAYPFDGRTIFENPGGSLSFETLKAKGLKARYQERLAQRKTALENLARNTGWQYHCHHTDASAQSALLWIYGALEKRR